jgi:hypothetical protein
MKSLSQEEKRSLMSISTEYIDVHREITNVEETIKRMEERSAELIGKLESCRGRERAFINELSNKYGDGKLDPMNLTWKKEEIKDGISQ